MGRRPTQLETGDRFGRLTVLKEADSKPDSEGKLRRQYLCKCDCGKTRVAEPRKLRSGHVRSCGCLGLDSKVDRLTTHGMRHSEEYRTWDNMKSRCTNKNVPEYQRYGARGILVCSEWLESFEAFYRDMGPKPTRHHTLDRIDNLLGYCKENCRWATQKEQCNNKRNNRRVSLNGEELTLAQWEDKLGLPESTLSARLGRGWSVERALTTPLIIDPHFKPSSCYLGDSP